ncbi:STAS domain-containing protein [Mycolicibacterium flavescens]|uniref:Anti-sigma factor antagonist n=1 Tax=Mycolicibacterium flavescens TaxID=1776 RepID=A0A1E3RRV2_MYCFV|nr:STAS domain-containing protein [Mycolicibacterium flavescens]MCV7279953.1 STAS domain-containing protein [Mycolicibacterium flavescens]ODQ92561.1 anti-anti-sigma factor [Mycolicibacterium flavescens]
MALLEVKRDVRDAAVVVWVGGEIDSGTVATLEPHFDAALQAAGGHPAKLLVVDLGAVTYFGSAGLNAVLDCYEKGSAAGVSVRVVATGPEVVRPLEVTRLDKVLRPYKSVADAVDG